MGHMTKDIAVMFLHNMKERLEKTGMSPDKTIKSFYAIGENESADKIKKIYCDALDFAIDKITDGQGITFVDMTDKWVSEYQSRHNGE
jgi:hypothetical protein